MLQLEEAHAAMKIFIGRTDAEAPKFSHLMGRTNSLEKTLLLGMIEGKKEIGVAEDEMVR